MYGDICIYMYNLKINLKRDILKNYKQEKHVNIKNKIGQNKRIWEMKT